MTEQTIIDTDNSFKEKLCPGLTGEASLVVTDANTAIALGSGSVPVLATPAMAALMEAAAVHALAGVLGEGQSSVGVHLDIQHLAATPLGLTVRAEARLMTIEGRRLTFRVSAFDDEEQVGVGTHQRVIVDTDRFLRRTAFKGKKG
ncbi:MAG: thioesterase family protein [Caldilineaceae bacterium]|nr:thioesterase family protein [Caldilineaceae bacterium]